MEANSNNEEIKTEVVQHPTCTEFISVPSFPLKAYEIVSDPNYKHIVRWTEEGDAFIITNKNAFSDQVLPVYFKHKNLSTFVRQLNIYGFKKTKYKNEEHCFAHKDFLRDNKRLLLNMKRKAKSKNCDKKSQSSDNSYFSKEEVVAMFSKMENRIQEQDKKIEKLYESNNNFKNSVLALYTQLEEFREREKRLEKFCTVLQPIVSNLSQIQYADEPLNKNFADRYADNNRFTLSNTEMSALIATLCRSLSGKFEKMMLSSFKKMHTRVDERRRFVQPSREQDILHNNMIENGPASSRHSQKSMRYDPYEGAVRRRDMKKMNRAPSIDNDLWEKISDLKSTHNNHNVDFLENIGTPEKEKNNDIYWVEPSFISEIDQNKDHELDNISVGSNNKFNELMTNAENQVSWRQQLPFLQNLNNCINNFEMMSQHSGKDVSDLKSVSSFSSTNKVCGIKRKMIN